MMREATASPPALTLTNVTPHPCRGSRDTGAGYHCTSWTGCTNVTLWRCT